METAGAHNVMPGGNLDPVRIGLGLAQYPGLLAPFQGEHRWSKATPDEDVTAVNTEHDIYHR